MKKSLIASIILILIVSVFSACKKKEMVIKGQFADSPFEKVELVPMADYEVFASANIEEDGSFVITIKKLKEGEYLLKFSGGNTIALYIGKVGDLDIDIEYDDVDFTVKYSGDYAEESTYVNNIRSKQTDIISDFAVNMINYDLDELCPSFKKLKEVLTNIVDGESTKNKKLVKIHHDLIPYIMGNVKLKYEIMMRDLSGKGAYKLPKEFNEYKKTISFDNKDLIEYDEFIEFIRLFYRFEFTQEMLELGSYNLAQYCKTYVDKIRSKPVPKRSKDIVLYTGIQHYMNELVKEKYDDLVKQVINDFDSKNFKKGMEESYKFHKGVTYRLSEGIVAPVWKARDINGKEFSLKSFKGNFVFVDVWATWCAPCIDQLPHLTRIANQCRSKNVKFVSISIDTNVEQWKKFVNQRDDEVIQLINPRGFKSNLVKQYEINSVPRFMLFNPQGKVINVDMDRPSNPDLYEYLLKKIGQKY